MKATSEGKPISIVPLATEMTTQAAAEVIGCSRPHLIKLLENGEIPFTMVGRHRRIKFEDVTTYMKSMKRKQEQFLWKQLLPLASAKGSKSMMKKGL